MKNRFMKKAFAVTLSAMMALTVSMAEDPANVSAKAPHVKLNTTFKTLKAGQAYKLKLKNNTLGWKITKAVSKDNTICKTVNKKAYVKLTAAGEGRTSIRVTLKTANRKGTHSMKKLSCRVNVKPAEAQDSPEMPDVPDTPKAETDKTVENQTDLEKALADQNVKKITIKTNDEKKFTIAPGEYKDVDVTVDAPKADVDNSGTFNSITIKAIKDSTWFEKAIGNAIRVEALKTRIVVEQGAAVSDVSLVTSNADVQIEVKGSIQCVHINAKLSAAISGTVTDKIPVVVDAAADNAALTFSAPVKVTLAANASIVFQKGAENSSLEMTEKTISAAIDTSVKINVKKADGTEQAINANQKTTISYNQTIPSSPSGNTDSYGGSSSSGGSGSSGGSNSSGGSSSSGSGNGGGTVTEGNTGKPAFEKDYPQIKMEVKHLTIVYKMKNASKSRPAEVFNVVSSMNTHLEANYDSVMHGHLGISTADYHHRVTPSIIDYLCITDENEHTCSLDVDVYDANEGLVVYSVIKGDKESLQTNKIDPQNAVYDVYPPSAIAAYHNQDKDKVYVYFSNKLDENSVPSKECFTIMPSNAGQAETVSGVSIAANPNNDVLGNYIALELKGSLADGSRLSYTKPNEGACIQDTAQNHNAVENFTLNIMPASPKISDVKVSADHKYMTISISPTMAQNDFMDIFINGINTNIDINSCNGVYSISKVTRIVPLANFPIDQNASIQSVEIKTRSGKDLIDKAFDTCTSIKYEGLVTEAAEAKIVSAEYSKNNKTLKIQTSGTNDNTSSLFGCDLALKVNGKEYELRGRFDKEWKDGQPSGIYTSVENALKHLDIPENADMYLVYNTKLTEDQFINDRIGGILIDMAGKPFLATTEDIKVTITD